MSAEETFRRFMPSHDRELIEKAQGGDLTAFEQLVHRYDKEVLSIAATYVETSEDAKDIYQEVFLRVYRGLSRFEFRSEFSTWLFRIATNVCISHRSRRKRHAHASIDDDPDTDESHPYSRAELLEGGSAADQALLNSEISTTIDEAIETLSPQQRLVFTLRHYQGYKLKEIATMMSCSEGTVKKYLFTGTQKMRDKLKHLL